MTEADLARLALAGLAGLAGGLLYFTLLWRSVAALTDQRRPLAWLLGGWLLRLAGLGLWLVLVAGDRWADWIAALLGLVLARAFVLRRHRPRKAAEALK